MSGTLMLVLGIGLLLSSVGLFGLKLRGWNVTLLTGFLLTVVGAMVRRAAQESGWLPWPLLLGVLVVLVAWNGALLRKNRALVVASGREEPGRDD